MPSPLDVLQSLYSQKRSQDLQQPPTDLGGYSDPTGLLATQALLQSRKNELQQQAENEAGSPDDMAPVIRARLGDVNEDLTSDAPGAPLRDLNQSYNSTDAINRANAAAVLQGFLGGGVAKGSGNSYVSMPTLSPGQQMAQAGRAMEQAKINAPIEEASAKAAGDLAVERAKEAAAREAIGTELPALITAGKGLTPGSTIAGPMGARYTVGTAAQGGPLATGQNLQTAQQQLQDHITALQGLEGPHGDLQSLLGRVESGGYGALIGKGMNKAQQMAEHSRQIHQNQSLLGIQPGSERDYFSNHKDYSIGAPSAPQPMNPTSAGGAAQGSLRDQAIAALRAKGKAVTEDAIQHILQYAQ